MLVCVKKHSIHTYNTIHIGSEKYKHIIVLQASFFYLKVYMIEKLPQITVEMRGNDICGILLVAIFKLDEIQDGHHQFPNIGHP